MAYYKHSRYLAQSDHDIFDKTLDPGINITLFRNIQMRGLWQRGYVY